MNDSIFAVGAFDKAQWSLPRLSIAHIRSSLAGNIENSVLLSALFVVSAYPSSPGKSRKKSCELGISPAHIAAVPFFSSDAVYGRIGHN
ncbi:MAG: hypothetical protein Q3X94_04585 [Oscillospiraceae bacterium]|nr:hypothetical protein [Oscillospiraceae bacterium]